MTMLTTTTGEQMRVGKILCLGRNYADHAREMGSAVPTVEPVVFLKPATAIIADGGAVVIPTWLSQEVHHEVELVVAIGIGGREIPVERALDHVLGYAVGLDMTLRDVQSKAKSAGEPWSVAKGWDTSAPLSTVTPRDQISDVQALEITLEVNGQRRQSSNTGDMIFPVADTIAYLSRIFTLEPGDLIYTGTPAGVGPVRPGDELVASVPGVGRLHVRVEAGR